MNENDSVFMVHLGAPTASCSFFLHIAHPSLYSAGIENTTVVAGCVRRKAPTEPKPKRASGIFHSDSNPKPNHQILHQVIKIFRTDYKKCERTQESRIRIKRIKHVIDLYLMKKTQ